jgi:hypothetical protein
MDEGRNMILLFPTLIHFKGKREDMAKFAPSCHMFYGRRVVDIPDGKPKWSGINNESELMEETPLYSDGGEQKKAGAEIDKEELKEELKKLMEGNGDNKKRKHDESM